MSDDMLDELARLDKVWDLSWKRRAQEAEATLDSLRGSIDVLQRELAVARRDIASLISQLGEARRQMVGAPPGKHVPEGYNDAYRAMYREANIYEKSEWAREWMVRATPFEEKGR